jgi:hypothetical protein
MLQVIVGLEGVWGTILTLGVVYPMAYVIPGADRGSIENPFDTINVVAASSELAVS